MSYIYENDGWKVWGMEIGGIGNTFVIDSHGLSLLAFAERHKPPLRSKANAVMFRRLHCKGKLENASRVRQHAKKPFQLSPSCAYISRVSEGDKPSFS